MHWPARNSLASARWASSAITEGQVRKWCFKKTLKILICNHVFYCLCNRIQAECKYLSLIVYVYMCELLFGWYSLLAVVSSERQRIRPKLYQSRQHSLIFFLGFVMMSCSSGAYTWEVTRIDQPTYMSRNLERRLFGASIHECFLWGESHPTCFGLQLLSDETSRTKVARCSLSLISVGLSSSRI